jgi:hypothetical protein
MTAEAAQTSANPDPGRPFSLARALSLDLLDNRYPTLHGLRVVAVITVVQYHVTEVLAFIERLPLTQTWVQGSMTIFFGMDCFFVLSGFLIGSILLRSVGDADAARADGAPARATLRERTQLLRRFYLRRMLRTFPAYYVVIAALALIRGLTAAQRRHLPMELGYLTNFLPLLPTEVVMFWGWSLALEEQFYLVVPLLFFALARLKGDRARFGLLGALWLSALVVRLAIFYKGAPWNDLELYGALYFRTYTRFDTLFAGIILALIHQRHGARVGPWLQSPRNRAALQLPALACLWFLLQPALFGGGDLQLAHIYAWGTVTSIMYVCVGLLLLHGDGVVHRFLSAHVFRRIATLGYGVYLVHIPLIHGVVAPASRALIRAQVPAEAVWVSAVALAMGASLALSYVLHVLIEKPAMSLRARVAA